METGQAPKQSNDAQSLHALVDELKSVHIGNGVVLINGAVLLLPKHRCCCDGSCQPRDNKEKEKDKRERERERGPRDSRK